ncbi:MAG: phage portal protein [Aquamicrobium sp.]|uniref:phage portal protein n=1 Tax=Aquamicrobium sp. TaxID=1872579 RepID=UPI00349ED83B|nr:phage portal protein [Aquamicrobium sp.]MCO5158964.1 phage portal protein [Aquamicrobium sp.]
MWPFSKPAAPPVEAKSGTASPNDWLLELFGAGVAGSPQVSRSVALTVPAVANAVKVISESVATAALTVKRHVGDQEVDVPGHPALALLAGEANGWTSGYELIRDLTAQALSQDAGGLAWVNRVQGRPAEIIRYDDGAITVEYSNKGTGEPTYRIGGKKIRSADIIHVRSGFSRCPLSLARDAIAAAKTMERYVVAFWAQSARPGGVITMDKGLGDTGAQKMLQGWKAAFSGSENAGRTAVLWDGAKWSPMTMTSVDAQLLELRKFQLSEIARAFGIPQHMLGVLDRATWGNYSQAAREYLTSTVLPWMRAVEAALNRTLLTDAERGEYRFAFDLDDFSQGDLGERATAISTLITARTINPNEARDWLGLPAREGGDEFSNPAIEPSTSTEERTSANESAVQQ